MTPRLAKALSILAGIVVAIAATVFLDGYTEFLIALVLGAVAGVIAYRIAYELIA